MLSATREQVLAFRIERHHLAQRLAHSAWQEAVHPVGLRNAVPGSLTAQLQARVSSVTGAEVQQALRERRLVEVMCTHGVHIVPPSEVPTFTLGAVPPSAADGALDSAHAAVLEVTADGPVGHSELSRGITERIDAALSPYCKACGCHHVDTTLFRHASQRAMLCRVPDSDGLVDRAERVVGQHLDADASAARTDLVHRFLRAHGPATVSSAAWWFNMPASEVKRELCQLEPALAPASYREREAWLHPSDVDALQRAQPAHGVRMLPPYDPLLTTGDRETLAPDPEAQRTLWRVVANSGAVLADGDVVAAWRATKHARRLDITVLPFRGWRPGYLTDVEAEANAVGALRGCDAVRVSMAG